MSATGELLRFDGYVVVRSRDWDRGCRDVRRNEGWYRRPGERGGWWEFRAAHLAVQFAARRGIRLETP